MRRGKAPVEDQLLLAKHLLQEKRYEEARTILEMVDHPTAQKWLAKLDEIAPVKQKQGRQVKKQNYTLPTVVVLIAIVLMVAILTNNPKSTQKKPAATVPAKQTAAVSATITETPVTKATLLPTPAEKMVFSEADYIQKLSNGLFITAGGRNIVSVKVANGRNNGGERVVIIAYLTTESTETGYADEWVDIFQGVAAAIVANELDVDSVSLVAGTAVNETAGILVAEEEDLMAFHRGEIGRDEFFQRLTIETFGAD